VAIAGITQTQALKLKGHIKNNNVMELIYTGSTHNLFNMNMEKRLNHFVYMIPNMNFMGTNLKKIENVAKYHKIKL